MNEIDSKPDFDQSHSNSEACWIALESAVEIFENAWKQNSDVDLSNIINGIDETFRARVLVELIKLDQEKRLEKNIKVPIEEYVRQWPELIDRDKTIMELIESEFNLLNQLGHQIPIDDYKRRFPKLSQHLEKWPTNSNAQLTESGWSPVSVSTKVLESIATGQAFESPGGNAQALPRGYKLGRYQVLSVLGRGGMGIVYLAKDSELDRLVAIKLLHPWIVCDDDDELLLREARTAAKLRHTSILPIFDFGKDDRGSRYVVMEYVDGNSLGEIIKTKSLSLDDAIELIANVADALDVAHRAGFVHRDVKPANILIDSSGNVLITDFGLAVRKTENISGEPSGTLPYMAPEQIGGEGTKLDGRTDVFALGVILYELLSGERPFKGMTINELKGEIQTKDPASLSKTSEGIPAVLDQICLKCLRKNPSERYASARQLADRLRSIHDPKPRFSRWRIAASLMFVSLLSVAGYYAYYGGVDWNEFLFGNIGFDICPELEDKCKLVLNLETEKTVDVELAFKQSESVLEFLSAEPDLNNQGLLQINFESDKAKLLSKDCSSGWVCWELPVVVHYAHSRPGDPKLDSSGVNQRDSTVGPNSNSINLTVRLAVSSDGQFQIGTKSPEVHDHLLVLAQLEGINNYRDIDYSDPQATGRPGFLKASDFGVPRDQFLVTADPRQTILAKWLVIVYRNFVKHGYVQEVSEVPSNAVIYRNEFSIANSFDQQITVVHGQLYHKHVRDVKVEAQHKDGTRKHEIESIALAHNQTWSPLQGKFKARDFNFFDAEDDAGRAYAKLHFKTKFDLPKDKPSVLFFHAHSDNLSSSAVSIRGLENFPHDDNIHEGLTNKNDWNYSKITSSKESNELVCQEFNISNVEGILFDPSFEEIELTALSTWSVVNPYYRHVSLGQVTVGESNSGSKIFLVEPLDDGIRARDQLMPVWPGGSKQPIAEYSARLGPKIWIIPPGRKGVIGR